MAIELRIPALPWPLPRGEHSVEADGATLAGDLRHLLWHWLPWTAPRLRLGPSIRPRTRLEISLLGLFRYQREWSAPALVARLALAPIGSDGDGTVLHSRPPGGDMPHVGRRATWRIVERWLAQELVVVARK
jgi:hypothetical protein